MVSILDSSSRQHSVGPRTGPQVLQCLPDLNPSRMTRRVIADTRALQEAGGQATVASAGGRLEPQLVRAGAATLPFYRPRGGVFASRTNQDLLSEMARADIDLLHVHGLADGQAARALADAANLPLIQTLYELPEASGFFQRRNTRRHLTGRPMVAVSQYLATLLETTFEIGAGDLHVIPTGVDLAALDEANVSTERTIKLADLWGVIEDARAIVLVPDATRDRAWLDMILNAAMSGPDALWLLIGDEPDSTEDLPAALKSYDVLSRVRWIPHCDDMAAALKLASVVASVPDLPVASCELVLEAQAMGRPVIVSDTGAGSESLLDGQSGWLVPASDADALSWSVARALDLDDSGRAHMGLAGRGFVQGHFAASASQGKLIDLYTSLRG